MQNNSNIPEKYTLAGTSSDSAISDPGSSDRPSGRRPSSLRPI